MEQVVVGYRLDTELSIYDLEKPTRCVMEWDGNPSSKKLARLAIRVGQDEMGEEAMVDGLRFRQRVEILPKQLQRRVNWSAFGGGEAHLRPGELEMPDEKERQRLLRNQRQVATRQANDQARLREVEQLRQGGSSTNGLRLGVRDLKKVAKELKRRSAGPQRG